jgi:hypothetical protein
MTSTVVVTTVVTADMSEDMFREAVLEQIRSNHQYLQERLAAGDLEARFMTPVTQAGGIAGHARSKPGNGRDLPDSDASSMNEGEFMDYALARLRRGEEKPLVWLTDAEQEEIEEESIGEHFSRHPYQY